MVKSLPLFIGKYVFEYSDKHYEHMIKKMKKVLEKSKVNIMWVNSKVNIMCLRQTLTTLERNKLDEVVET